MPSPKKVASITGITGQDGAYTEEETLLGDATKAREKLGWTPRTTFEQLMTEMVREDLKSAERDELVKKHGFQPKNHFE